MIRKLTLAMTVVGAILFAPGFSPSQVVRADDDDLEDYYEDLADAREDYYEDLEDAREDYYDDLDDYHRNYLRTHRHYYHNGHVHVRTQYYGYATDCLHPRNYTYYSARARYPYHGHVYAAPYHTHGTYLRVQPRAGHVHGYHYRHEIDD